MKRMVSYLVCVAMWTASFVCLATCFAAPLEHGKELENMHSDKSSAIAYDVEIHEVYQPKDKPGYACWANLWRATSGELMLSFIEKRRIPSPSYKPIPLDFWESMVLPLKYQASFCNGDPNILTECVTMRSADEGKTWIETGRFDTGGMMNLFAATSSGDGAILRVTENSYLAFSRDDKPATRVQKSTDGGKTWQILASLLEDDYQGTAYRLKRMHDGMLVALCPFSAGFGPGRPRQDRHTTRPDVVAEWQVGCWTSHDDGRSWAGPLIVLPGILADEPDFVELPSGDLLILNSAEQGGPQMRQYVRRTKTGLVPGPVYKVVSGTVPETVCVTKAGLLVGAIRCGAYTCSNDDGATWHEISGLPKCNYQPLIIELKDGRFLCAWHKSDEGPGGDHFVGQDNQFVGEHIFGLDASGLPAPTALKLSRDMNNEQTRYINSFTACLTAGGKPLTGKSVRFKLRKCYPFTASDEPEDVCRTTDANGTATLIVRDVFKDIDEVVDIFRDCYYIQAFFDSSAEAALSRAESPMTRIYPMTAEKKKAYSYPLFVFEGKVFVTPDTMKRFPEIVDFVRLLREKKIFTQTEAKESLGITDSRLAELMEFLVANHLLRKADLNSFEWRAELYSAGGVSVLEIEDQFE